jgi:predicted dehydrogenase
MTDIGWGIVGCGWVARDYVAPGLTATAGARIVALCDRDPRALAAIAPDASDTLRTDDLDAFLAAPGLDAVYVATPNRSHPDLVAAAARAGKAVLCEKPMARTADEAEGMARAVGEAGVLYGTAFDQRWHPAHVVLRELIESGELGTITSVRIRYACWTPSDWQPDTTGLYQNWRVDPAEAGGGAFIDLAPHGLDLTGFLLGEPVAQVAALFQNVAFEGYAVDDGAALVGQTESGALLSLSVAYNCPDAFPRRLLEVTGTRGHALALNTMGQTPGGTLTLTRADGTRENVAFDTDASPFARQIAAFSDAVRGASSWPFPIAGDLHIMRLLDAATRSAAGAAPATA